MKTAGNSHQTQATKRTTTVSNQLQLLGCSNMIHGSRLALSKS